MSADSADPSPLVIHLWSPPRCNSTALMYSFAQRADTEVIDEPLYAGWLAQNPAEHRPYREQLLATPPASGAAVMAALQTDPVAPGKSVRFCKHMSKHFSGVPPALARGGKHVLLVRHPMAIAKSFKASMGSVTLADTGFPQLVDLRSTLRSLGVTPIIVDADLLRADPKGVLSELCAQLGLPFDPAMLQWPAGPKSYDGLWAPFWYKATHASTSFEKPSLPSPVDPQLFPLVEDAFPFYELLHRHAIGRFKLDRLQSLTVEDHGLTLPALPDDRNASVMVWVGGHLVPRSSAAMSVFDSTVQGGDAVWEGLRVFLSAVDGLTRVHHLDEHIARMHASAHAMAFDDIPSSDAIKHAIFSTLAANNMRDGVHIRLTLSRGEKTTSSMNPKFNVYGSKLIVLAEWKPVEGAATYDNTKGISLISSTMRRNPPQCVPSQIHHNNLINNILAKIQANVAGAADAIMLDCEGFVSETNATNIFCVRGGVLMTPFADHCLPGITRAAVLAMAPSLGIAVSERRLAIVDFYTAEEVFTTGTMGELTPVTVIDGRRVGSGVRGPVTQQLQVAWRHKTHTEGVLVPDFPK